MNKEYVPDWDQPVSRIEEPAVAVKSHTINGVKQIVTIRLDVDMLDWFKSAGPGYQTRINQVLREHMNAQRAGASQD
ncbi:MAG: BrnA antitoxin family protein [Telluria sp.]